MTTEDRNKLNEILDRFFGEYRKRKQERKTLREQIDALKDQIKCLESEKRYLEEQLNGTRL